jgi:hypothetical protein
MPIIGTIIPFIGFRRRYIDADGFPLPDGFTSRFASDCFEVEWLMFHVILFTTSVKEV